MKVDDLTTGDVEPAQGGEDEFSAAPGSAVRELDVDVRELAREARGETGPGQAPDQVGDCAADQTRGTGVGIVEDERGEGTVLQSSR
ncbi:hypothetical protein ASF46_15375 [Rathayibacter sp. Leaf296]|nr:hypothetical protein [Rathayibacter sp. Leaf296]KQQ08647.1 hypothetical protein ASF46_15375 [Rathayibacter sp. Leaf296]